MTVFLAIAGVGVLILALGMVFDGFDEVGHIADVFDVTDGLLSITAIGTGLTILGAAGITTTLAGLPPSGAIPVAVALGIAAWVGVARVIRALRKASKPVPHDPVGLTGVTTRATTSDIGEVTLDHHREVNKRLARTAAGTPRIPAGTRIVVTDLDGETVIVAPDTTSDHTSGTTPARDGEGTETVPPTV